MPAYYHTTFYVHPDRIELPVFIQNAARGLLSAGCTYKHVEMFVATDPTVPWQQQVLTREERAISLEEAGALVARHLAKPDGSVHAPHLVLGCDFEFDRAVRDRILTHGGQQNLARANEVWLSFIRSSDEHFGKPVEVTINTYAEYVLMYGDEGTHERNLQRILAMAESVYDRVEPYFGWMDEESSAWDQSYEKLIRGEFPLGNEFVFIGKELLPRANLKELQRSGHWHKTLSDGGVVIRWAAKDRWETA